MSFEWCYTTIGDQLTLQRGIDIRQLDQVEGEYPVISSSGISSFHNDFRALGPGVLLGRKGVVGSVWFCESDYWPHSTTLWVKDFKGNHPRFVYYFFKSIVAKLKSLDVGSANPTLNRNHVHPTEVFWPNNSAQVQIAHILGSLDDKIELNRRMSATLEEMARAIFKSWFIDFDPVHAKAEGRPTNLPPEIETLFSNSFQDSKLGQIPTGWSASVISNVSTLNPENWKSRSRPLSIRYIDLANTKWGEIQKFTNFSNGDAPSRAQRVLRSGDTLIGTVRPGNGAYTLINEEGLTGSTGFAVLRPNENARSFVYLASTSPDQIERLTQLADGGAYPAVRPEIVGSLPIALASIPILKAFEELVGPLLDRVASAKQESLCLSEARNTLLPKLISGELSVADAEKFTKGVLV